jgi:hypothetical protein
MKKKSISSQKFQKLFRSGYYRDQTFMMAIGEMTVEQFLPDYMVIQT